MEKERRREVIETAFLWGRVEARGSGHEQGGDPFGSRGTTSSGAFDISALRPATGLGLERREASAAPKKAQEGEGSEFLGA